MSYVSARTSTIRPGAELLFDVYVYYKETYIAYRRVSERFEQDILRRFKAKNVKKIFIPADQEAQYLKFLDQALDQLQVKGVEVGERAELAQGTLKQESENIAKTLDSEEAYRSSEARIHKVVDFMMNEPKALAGMLAAAGLSVDDSAHGSTVSSFCLAVGSHAKSLSREELTDLAIAGLLHDTGLKPLGFALKDDLATIPMNRKADFRRHPAVAVEQVAGKKFITARVLRLIEDHEEFGEGNGFPEKKRMAKLPEDSRIFNLCDAFDHFCVNAGKPAIECIDAFIESRAEHFDLKLIEVLESQVKAR
jgi:HD-GYP domain-containing protein (c-di-GMP phosphodiesterase class II)